MIKIRIYSVALNQHLCRDNKSLLMNLKMSILFNGSFIILKTLLDDRLKINPLK